MSGEERSGQPWTCPHSDSGVRQLRDRHRNDYVSSAGMLHTTAAEFELACVRVQQIDEALLLIIPTHLQEAFTAHRDLW